MSGRDDTAASVSLAPTLQLMGVERVGVSGGGGVAAGGGAGAVNGASAAAAAAPDRLDEPPRKRAKLAGADDAAALRRRILECELLRLRNLRERFTEQLSELYFLQAGGNMMDYAAWRKRPPAPQLVAFLEARRPREPLDPPDPLDAEPRPEREPEPERAPTPAAKPPPEPEPEPEPEPVERPEPQPEACPAAPPAPAAPAAGASSSGGAGSGAGGSASAADEMVEKAKQEAYVAGRVAELARAGLWAERRLPRVLEPPRPKTHWDYLLEEMAWLAQDFAHERKWKKQAARKCARAVQKYFQDKAVAAQKAEKAQEAQLRKIAAFAAKEIRTFWANVEKLVEWKRVRRVERARKEALDEQLSYIVDRTEQYSRQLAANMGRPDGVARPDDDDEFQPLGASDDDEETIAAAERDDAADHRAELEALRRESSLDLGDLLPPGYLRAHSPPPSDYGPDADDSADDEETIAEQERAERQEDRAAELAALRHEADLSVDELRRRYAGPPPADRDPDATDADTPTGTDAGGDSDDDTDSDDVSDSASSTASEALEALMDTEAGGETAQLAADDDDTTAAAAGAGGAEGGEGRVEAAASLAASLQPTGTTLSETAVGTPVPRLLKHSLREYQHVGLHWLATMHARRLNGILADEMGLGKTIQTIALLAHLALERRDWGPHLVVAPTSVVLNWEMEFKKWCPAFKILTYYGTIKERKLKRVGWTKANSFHVCITSYKLVVQDHQSFRRKRWKYLILDEAQNIKNFKSQRWQMLLNFQTERRLLLTGTPLQNSLLELWSLMHFLMPDVFASHTEFREWFSDVAGIAEGSQRYNEALVRRLHEVLRPFLLRRLKADVERQMPRKYEHVLLCRLAKRQRFLYDDFMSRAKTKESLASGNLLSVINVLMQLRKVCNHPDLFEPRPVASPLHLPALRYAAPALALAAGVAERVHAAARLGGDLATLELRGAGAFAAHRARHLAPPRRALEDLHERRPPAPPRPPPAALRLHLRLVPRCPHAALAAPPPPSHLPPLRPAAAAAAPAPAPAATPAASGSGGARLEARRRACLRRLAAVNERRCWRLPLYGADLRDALHAGPPPLPPVTLQEMLDKTATLIDRFSVCWSTARAACPVLAVCGGAGAEADAEADAGGARAWRARCAALDAAAAPLARRLLAVLHAPALKHAVAFPHPSLLQYDCGKLQTLDALLRRLKAGGHRVLIFTQMTRVLDVLEAFLSMHGHTYLRLDGATRVDQRQPLVDRFNADTRVFAFILSTRSGGVGLNLTGADSVVFYDSDWNPTMDAQAQDRCHRIGQTRDVHVFRLVTAATVEENILRKAEQKRALGHLAIEDGHFTTSYLRASNIKELFDGSSESETGGGGAVGASETAAAGGELECALAAAEDEADAAAAAAARAEAQGDLAEFDETLPIDDDKHSNNAATTAKDKHADELAALMKQLTPIEKYAMRVVESGEAATAAERAALEEMRRQLHEWERARQQLRDEPAPPPEPDPELTYCREDAAAQVWVSDVAAERMPMWCPPTPPSGEGDVYCESWSRALYRRGAAADALLPPVHRRSPRPPRSPRRARVAPRPPQAPPSLFERAGPRPRPRARAALAPHPHAPQPEWAPCEDAALRRALRLQRLPADPPAALALNWEWVAELVNEAARAYRSPRACRDRHDALADPERARRKHKRPPAARRRALDDAPRPPVHRLDAMRDAAERRRQAPKRRLDDADRPNPKHAALLADHGVDYEAPPTPMEVATRRAERIAKEKLKAGAASGASAAAAPAPPPAAASAPAPAAPPAPAGPAQRIVVAAAKAEPRRARPALAAPGAGGAVVAGGAGEAPRGAPAQLLYRQQTLAARHQLKILHHAPASVPHSQGGVSTVSGGVVEAGSSAALRTLQLQQLALRRATPAGVAGVAGVASVSGVSGGVASVGSVASVAGAGGARLVAGARHSHVVVAHLAPPSSVATTQPSAAAHHHHRPNDHRQ